MLVLGHVLDENGKKMSKSKGNVIDPFEAFDMHGADALRFYFVSNTQPWNSQRFYHKAVAEAKAKFIDLLQNIHAFYALYAGIDGFNPYEAEHVPVAERPLMDRWIIARLHQTIQRVDAAYDRLRRDAGRARFCRRSWTSSPPGTFGATAIGSGRPAWSRTRWRRT